MVTSKKEKESKPGRPEKQINWDIVETMIAAGCNGTGIAQAHRIHPETFYDRFYKEYGEHFTGFAGRQLLVGENNLLLKQYQKALSEKGDTALLIHLGKVRLKQKEPDKEEGSPTVPNDEFLSLQHELYRVKYELEQLKNANQPEAT